MKARTLLLPLLLALWACGGEGESGESGGSGEAPDAGAAPAPGMQGGETPGAEGPERLVGIFATGQGVMELQPCDGGEAVALQGPSLENLVAIADQIAPGTEPVTTIFADLVVTWRSAEGTNVGGGYTRIADVMGVRRAAFEGFGCDGPMPGEVALMAAGNEPFWQVRVLNDSVAEVSRPDEGTQTLAIGSLQQDLEGVVLTGSVTGEGTVFLEVTTGTCRDDMSGAVTHARATFTLGGRRMEGCAWFGTALDPDVTPMD